MVPLVPGREFAAHEQQLLAGLGPLHGVQQAQVGEPLPVVARHLVEQRPLAVHDLVVAERQHEVLARRVHRPERDLAVVPLAMDRVAFDVRERVVHPPHVPLAAEAEPADVGRPAHHRPRGRLLGDRRDVGELAVHGLVELAQEHDRVEVLAAAELVGDPLAFVARVVEVEHRGDGVDPQPVDVVAVEPTHRARDQERPHLVAAVVEDRRVPVGVVALARVGVLEQVGAVELVQAVAVGGEVRRHPVEDHADAALVEPVDHRHQVGRRAVAGGRREEAGGLVAPRPVERVLHDRQELDVRETVRQHMVGDRVGELVVAGKRRPSVTWRPHEPRCIS